MQPNCHAKAKKEQDRGRVPFLPCVAISSSVENVFCKRLAVMIVITVIMIVVATVVMAS